jgi:hypothetical protein
VSKSVSRLGVQLGECGLDRRGLIL